MAGFGPRFLEGNYGPIGMECDAPHLPVAGELPRGLEGTLYRNGPDPQFPPPDPAQHHWFSGDGMVHAFTLSSGRASYRNRWVRTAKWRAEAAAGRSLLAGYGPAPRGDGAGFADEGTANTNVIRHAGRLLALEEGHLPVELDPATLATRGVQRFGGALDGPFTAHPKLDPATGELVFFGFCADGALSGAMSWGTLAPDGRVARFERFEAPYCSLVHDFAVTERHVVFPVLPLSGSAARLRSGAPAFAWEPALGGHLGVMRRDRGVASMRWLRVESCFVFHVLNAWEEGDRILVDVMQHDEPTLFPRADGTAAGAGVDGQGYLTRWTLDLGAGGADAVARARLDDTGGEFPRIDERRTGLRNRYGAFAGRSGRRGAGGELDSVVWLDLRAGRHARFALPAGDAVSEPVFVPRHASAGEGDGWLLVVAWRGEERRSDLLVFDAGGIADGPVATVRLSHRVPFGFHGNWVPAAA